MVQIWWFSVEIWTDIIFFYGIGVDYYGLIRIDMDCI